MSGGPGKRLDHVPYRDTILPYPALDVRGRFPEVKEDIARRELQLVGITLSQARAPLRLNLHLNAQAASLP